MTQITEIFATDAKRLLEIREEAIRIHASNIRAAGDQIEISVRNYLERLLPNKYYVGHGHIIDKNGATSNQLDIIISDNENLPSLIKTESGTEYIPFDSIYSIGEVKSTYRKTEKPISKFSKAIGKIRSELNREEVENTFYDGMKGNTAMRDMILGKRNKYLNKLFSFMIFLDKGDFDVEFAKKELNAEIISNLPNLIIILNLGIISYAEFGEERFSFTRYPDEFGSDEARWYLFPLKPIDKGSKEGNHLAFLYYCLIQHLVNSYLEPPSISNYIQDLLIGKKSETVQIT